MKTTFRRAVLIAVIFCAVSALAVTAFRLIADRVTPGIQADGSVIVTTNQTLTPFGKLARIEGARAKDLALSPDGSHLAVLCNGRVAFFDSDGNSTGEVRVRTGALGVAWSPDGMSLWVSGDQGQVTQIVRSGEKWTAGLAFKPDLASADQSPRGGNPQPCGVAVESNGEWIWVALGRRNVATRYRISDLVAQDGATLPATWHRTQVAPYQLTSNSFGVVAIANRGGVAPSVSEPRADSTGTPVAIDPATDAALRGSVTLIHGQNMPEHIQTGRQPSGLAFSPDGKLLAVADSDSDTVTFIDVDQRAKTSTAFLRPPIEPRFGHMPTDVAFSDDGQTLFVTVGGVNAVAVLKRQGSAFRLAGHIPTAWYPISLEQKGGKLFVACSKGVGSRLKDKTTRFGVHDNVGTVQFIDVAEAMGRIADLSAQVAKNNHWGEELPARANQPARPIPERLGEPSVFKHVVYIIKENHTYDTDFGDIEEGNGDPSLCIFGEEVTPNQHALARQFVLLDNTYTSGTNSADGHQWTSTAIANAYTEQNYSANIRSYPYDGGDPLAFSPNGFLWTVATANKISVRVYGEFVDKPVVRNPATGKTPTWTELWQDYKSGANKMEIRAETSQAALRKVLHPRFIGFPSIVSDQWRADQYLAELAEWEKSGEMPSLSILLLPNDHTAGTSPSMPTPRATVADGDLALGRIVDALSHSKFWKETLILMIMDDSQLGLDHVDGHRTVALAVSPYTRRGAVVSEMYNHTSFIRTMGLVLGFPALTRFDRVANPLTACFAPNPDYRPFTHVKNRVPLDEMNPPAKTLTGLARELADKSAKLDWEEVDLADADVVARAVWNAQRPGERFPAEHFHPNRDDDD